MKTIKLGDLASVLSNLDQVKACVACRLLENHEIRKRTKNCFGIKKCVKFFIYKEKIEIINHVAF